MPRSGFARCFAAALVGFCVLTASSLWSAEKRAAREPADEVELFAAMAAGELEVRLVPKDAKQATVVVTNKTKRPLSVRLPAAFAGVPVLAQQPFNLIGGNNNFGLNNNNNGGQNQAIGGGFNQQGQGQNQGNPFQFGNQRGLFSVEPEKTRKLKVAVMCLEHGKKDPSLSIHYRLVPIESYTSQAEVVEVCRLLGQGEVEQVTAQAAVWHLANGKSWDDLAEMLAAKHLNGSTELFFTPDQLRIAKKIARIAEVRSEQAAPRSDSLASGVAK